MTYMGSSHSTFLSALRVIVSDIIAYLNNQCTFSYLHVSLPRGWGFSICVRHQVPAQLSSAVYKPSQVSIVCIIHFKRSGLASGVNVDQSIKTII